MGALKKKTGIYYGVNAILTVILFVVLLILIDSSVLSRYNTTIVTNVQDFIMIVAKGLGLM